MSFAVRVALFILAVSISSVSPGNLQALTPGEVVEKVVCANDRTQTYSLYLPSTYSRTRKWPIVYAFDPRARGRVPVERFKAAAERFGYIIVGSNNSRNGPMDESARAFGSLLVDTNTRLSLDLSRVYLTGFSGGARFAVAAAVGLTGATAAGVIGCGAGLPEGFPLAEQRLPFPYFGTVGTDDFNFPEMKELDAALKKLGVPHQLHVFDGPHDWPSSEACMQAIEWMEVQAIRSNARPKDDALLDSLLGNAVQNAEAEEKAGHTFQAYRQYSALCAEFAGLRDVTAYEQKVRQLSGTKEVRRSLSEEANSIERQRAADQEIVKVAERALEGEDRTNSTMKLLAILGTLKTRSQLPENDGVRMAARRVLVSSWARFNEATTQDFGSAQYARAASRLELMRQIRPEDPRVAYTLACAYARLGRKSAAIKALEDAVKNGFNDGDAINADPDLQSLRGDEAFTKIVAGLKK